MRNVQLIAAQQTLKSAAEENLTAAYHAMQRPAIFDGMMRTYLPNQEEGEPLPPETTVIQKQALPLLRQALSGLSGHWDNVASVNYGNTQARADIKVGEQVILKDVPVETLLFIEKALVNIRTFISKIPTLDPAKTWTWDAANGYWVTGETWTIRTKKEPRVIRLAQATEQHPEQSQLVQEDVAVGRWITRYMSSAIRASDAQALLRQVDVLMLAVKSAREEANTANVPLQTVAQPIFDFILRAIDLPS